MQCSSARLPRSHGQPRRPPTERVKKPWKGQRSKGSSRESCKAVEWPYTRIELRGKSSQSSETRDCHPDAPKATASRFYQLLGGHAMIALSLKTNGSGPTLASVGATKESRLRTTYSRNVTWERGISRPVVEGGRHLERVGRSQDGFFKSREGFGHKPSREMGRRRYWSF